VFDGTSGYGDHMQLLTAATALLLVVAAGLAAVVWPRGLSYAAVIVFAVLWLRVNGPLAGYVLATFGRDEGLTLADLLVPVEVLAIGAVSARKRRALAGAEQS
jgi:hypothetical protein